MSNRTVAGTPGAGALRTCREVFRGKMYRCLTGKSRIRCAWGIDRAADVVRTRFVRTLAMPREVRPRVSSPLTRS